MLTSADDSTWAAVSPGFQSARSVIVRLEVLRLARSTWQLPPRGRAQIRSGVSCFNVEEVCKVSLICEERWLLHESAKLHGNEFACEHEVQPGDDELFIMVDIGNTFEALATEKRVSPSCDASVLEV